MTILVDKLAGRPWAIVKLYLSASGRSFPVRTRPYDGPRVDEGAVHVPDQSLQLADGHL
jgi:hypothetical protein